MIIGFLGWKLPQGIRRNLNVHSKFGFDLRPVFRGYLSRVQEKLSHLNNDIQELENSIEKKYLHLTFYLNWHLFIQNQAMETP